MKKGLFFLTLVALLGLIPLATQIPWQQAVAEATKTPNPTPTAFVAPTQTPQPLPMFGQVASNKVDAQAEVTQVPPVVKIVETIGDCKMTVVQAVALARKVAAEANPKIPWKVAGPLWLSESSFHHWVYKDGKCVVNASFDEHGKEIAVGLGQVYADLHPECEPNLLKTDPEYNLVCAAKILISRTPKDSNGNYDWDKGVAYYKGIEVGDEFWLRYKSYQNAGKFYDLQSKQEVSLAGD